MKHKISKSQLFELHQKSDCTLWRENIEEIISECLKSKKSEIEIDNDSKYVKLLMDKGSNDQKALVESYGIKLVSNDITDKIKTFEDALAIVGCSDPDVLALLAYKGTNQIMLGAVALAKLEIIIKALNEGWNPNWTDSNEYKYYVWSQFESLGWSCYGYYCNYAASAVGSRLVVRSQKLSIYLGTQFQPLYNVLFNH